MTKLRSPHDQFDEYGYAAFHISVQRPLIHIGVVRRLQREVRHEIGSAWAYNGETPRRGWERARKAGWRVIAVRVTQAFGSADLALAEGGDHAG